MEKMEMNKKEFQKEVLNRGYCEEYELDLFLKDPKNKKRKVFYEEDLYEAYRYAEFLAGREPWRTIYV